MSLRCKPGDLAIYIGRRKEFIGKPIKILEFKLAPDGPGWLVDPPVYENYIDDFGTKRRGDWQLDRNLRPIRDQDGEDEMLAIAGKPEGVTV